MQKTEAGLRGLCIREIECRITNTCYLFMTSLLQNNIKHETFGKKIIGPTVPSDRAYVWCL